MTESSGATTDTVGEPGIPEPPKEFVDAAKLAPDHWLYSIDPAWQGEGPPPDWAVVGQWRSDLDGVIVEWEDNENYQPSPEALGWPEPADDVDAAIQLATTGYGPAEDVTSALAKAEVAVLVTAAGEPVSASAPDGTPIVPIFTSPRYLHLAGRLGFEQVRVPALLSRLPEGHSLCINSSAPVSMIMTAEGLAEIAATAAESPEEEPPAGETPEVAWPTTVDVGEHASLRDALTAHADRGPDRGPDSALDGEPDGTPDSAPDSAPDGEPGAVDLPLPEPDAGEAR